MYRRISLNFDKEKVTEKRYFNQCNYNQSLVLNGFIKRLLEQYPNMLINDNYINPAIIYNRDTNDEKTFHINLHENFLHYSFIIDEYKYYIQFDPNPFFNTSYISCTKIYSKGNSKEKYYKQVYAGERNINDFFDDIYDSSCNIEQAINNLMEYFIKEVKDKQGEIYNEQKDILLDEIEDNKEENNMEKERIVWLLENYSSLDDGVYVFVSTNAPTKLIEKTVKEVDKMAENNENDGLSNFTVIQSILTKKGYIFKEVKPEKIYW